MRWSPVAGRDQATNKQFAEQYHRRTAHDLVHDLHRAHLENRLERRLRVYIPPWLLLIDRVGYLPLNRLEATLFFHLVSSRYERGSMILTSDKSFPQWGEIFGDTVIATVILDRLLHHRCEWVKFRRVLTPEAFEFAWASKTLRYD